MSFLEQEILLRMQKYCAYQERCHAEVRTKLYELGCNKDTTDNMIVKLIETNYLNEERFAKAFAGGKFRVKKWGKVKITNELKARKISDYCIKSGLKEIDDHQYMQTLQHLIQKSITAKPDWSWQIKTTKWLLGKGYEYDLIKDCMQSIKE
jgi:regulatory protein